MIRRKFLPFLPAILLTAGIAASALAEESLVPACEGASCEWGDLLILLDNLFDYFLIIAAPIAGGIIVIGGVYITIHPANDSKRSEAKKIIWAAVIGLIIVLGAYAIVKTVLEGLGAEDAASRLRGAIQ